MTKKKELEMNVLEQVNGGKKKTKEYDKKLLKEIEKYFKEHREDLLQS